MKHLFWTKVLTISCLFAFNFAEAKEKAIVVVVDTGIDLKDPRFADVLCKTGHKDFTGTGLEDTHGHGTHVVGLIKKYAKDANYCIVMVKWTNGKDENHYAAMRYLYKLHPDVVNMSLTGYGFNEDEYLVIKQNPMTEFVVAAGNNGVDLKKKKVYPAVYGDFLPNVTTVGSLGENAERYPSSNYGLEFMQWEAGENILSTCPYFTTCRKTGTSMATAIATGKYVQTHFK